LRSSKEAVLLVGGAKGMGGIKSLVFAASNAVVVIRDMDKEAVGSVQQ